MRTGTTAATPSLPGQPAEDPRTLASQIDESQQLIDDPSSPAGELAAAGRLQQLATRELQRAAAKDRRAVLADLDPEAVAGMRANLAAAQALSGITAPQRQLPRWRIIAPPAAGALLAYFRQAGANSRIPWEILAAIEFVETKFGRLAGTSTAGAQGPMQFLPDTWARYGRGRIDDPREAIFAAARLLAANGAPGDIAGALYHYNESSAYVRAVESYAGRMRADLRAYYGYYYWQVLYKHVGGTVILPQGYPKVRPVPIGPNAPR